MSDAVIIELKNVYKSFGQLVVLAGVDLQVRQGSTTVVIGPSGCGKTVLLKHMIVLLHPDAGEVFFDRQDITHMSERELVAIRRRVGFVFQGGALFDSVDVQGNVCFPLAEHHISSADEQADRCREALRIVGLNGLQYKMPGELSGGQKKRVALARAIVLEPDVILYDEPTTGLDPVRADLINELIIKLQHELNTTAVVVTHDMASARKVGDRIVMLYNGSFIADASPAQLDAVTDETVRHFVDGRASKQELRELELGYFLDIENGQATT
ncbi:MAG: ABC transporter ATP-binding protein [Planctomycetes bacterium]|nr:ABC transporter ATP-binding protein [Planctomycetota bacterium]